MNRRTRAAAVAFTVVTAAGLTGCAQIEGLLGGEPERGDDGQVTETTEGVSVLDLQQGDCTSQLGESEMTEIDLIPCEEPHSNEIYHAYDLPEGDFPGADEVDAQAVEACKTEFETFIGLTYDESALEVNYLVPTQESWESDDDRTVLCFVYDPAADTTGTLADAAR